MKKIFLFTTFTLITLSASCQSKSFRFGVVASFLHTEYKTTLLGDELNDNKLQYQFGAHFEFLLNQHLDLQTQIFYIPKDFANRLSIPIQLKGKINDRLNLFAGPQVLIELNKLVDDFNPVNFGASLGSSYDVDKNISIQIGYFWQISKFYEGDLDFKAQTNYLNLGLVFKI